MPLEPVKAVRTDVRTDVRIDVRTDVLSGHGATAPVRTEGPARPLRVRRCLSAMADVGMPSAVAEMFFLKREPPAAHVVRADRLDLLDLVLLDQVVEPAEQLVEVLVHFLRTDTSITRA